MLCNILLHYVAKMSNSILADLRRLLYWNFIFFWTARKTTTHFLKVMWHLYQIDINTSDFFFKLFLNILPSSFKSSIYFNLELLKTQSRKLQSVLKIIYFLNLTHLNASALQSQTVLVVLIEVYNALDIQIRLMPSICYAKLQTLYITWFIYIKTAFTNRAYRNRCIL